MKKLIIIILLFSPQVQADLFVKVRPHTEVDLEQSLAIGDITDFSGFDGREIESLKAHKLGFAPAPGETKEFSSMDLSHIFRDHLRVIEEMRGEKVNLVIPARVVVSRKIHKLQVKAVEREILKAVAKLCTDCEFQVSDLRVPKVPNAAKWDLLPLTAIPQGSFSLPVKIQTAAEAEKRIWISGQIRVFRKVPVARGNLYVGAKLQTSDFAIEKKNVTFGHGEVPTAEELERAYVNRPIAAGQIISRSMLRGETATKPGQTVKVVTGSEGWAVSIDGVAQQSGQIGDYVRVRIPRTQKQLSGVVKANGIVEVR